MEVIRRGNLVVVRILVALTLAAPCAVAQSALLHRWQDANSNQSHSHNEQEISINSTNEAILNILRSIYGEDINDDPELTNLLTLLQATYPVEPGNCLVPDNLGPVEVNNTYDNLDSLADLYPDVSIGGRYTPNCKTKSRVAIIVPHRGKESNLATFVAHMHPFLMKQRIEYGIFVVQEIIKNKEDYKLNRGVLMNLGFLFANQDEDEPWDCYVFHDLNLLPLDTRNLYSCSPQPRRMSVAIDSLEPIGLNRLLNNRVLMFPREVFIKVNGFSNFFWGRVGVYENMQDRLQNVNEFLHQLPKTIAKYSISEELARKLPNGNVVLPALWDAEGAGEEAAQDGLSSLDYKVVSITRHRLFSKVDVSIDINSPKMSRRNNGYPSHTNELAFSESDSSRLEQMQAAFEHTYPVGSAPSAWCTRPKGLGPIKADLSADSISHVADLYPDVRKGGRYAPDNCTSKEKIAIIVPYRNREQQLAIFLKHIHPFLMAQRLEYAIFVIEQYGKYSFNRGALLNVGYLVSANMVNVTCYVFHDIDLLPLDTRNLYSCARVPRHLSVALDSNVDNGVFGGVVSMTGAQFEYVNGFPNRYWGWGGEDDDLFVRILMRYGRTVEFPAAIGTYTMLPHQKAAPNPKRFDMLKDAENMVAVDGITTVQYQIMKFTSNHLYTIVKVFLPMLPEK